MYPNLGGTEILMYDLFGLVSLLSLFFFNFINKRKKEQLEIGLFALLFNHISKSKKINIAKIKKVFLFSETLIISVVQCIPITFNSNFGNLVKTNANYFGLLYFAPLVLYIFFLLLFINPLTQSDLITPAYPLALFFAKLGCFCSGCCNGIEISSGMFNHDTNRIEFPVQLVETALALLIFIFLLYYRRKSTKGTLFPIYMILYSSTRFFSEFLRSDPATMFGLKHYQIFCIIGVILGILELFVIKKFSDHILNFYNTVHEFCESKFNSCVAAEMKKNAKNSKHKKKKKKR